MRVPAGHRKLAFMLRLRVRRISLYLHSCPPPRPPQCIRRSQRMSCTSLGRLRNHVGVLPTFFQILRGFFEILRHPWGIFLCMCVVSSKFFGILGEYSCVWKLRIHTNFLKSSTFLGILRTSSRFFDAFFEILRNSSKFFGILRNSSEFFGILRSSSKFFGILRLGVRFCCPFLAGWVGIIRNESVSVIMWD